MFTDIRLQNFRSYTDEAFELSSTVNIIVGPNASGKTNLLEAVLVLMRGSSYRVRDAELIRFQDPWARLSAHGQTTERVLKLIRDPAPQKVFEIDGQLIRRLTARHKLPVVLFEPNHLQLLGGPPEARRSYLDDLLEQSTAGFGSLRRDYKRTLLQRNALLKQDAARAASQMFAWDVRLSEQAGKIVRARSELISELQAELPALYKEISGAGTRIEIEYDCQFAPEHYETRLMHSLQASLETDIARGFTGHGPHREDFSVYFNGRPATETASRGELRTAILGLKILELRILQARHEIPPVLLLDDVFSELDGARRKLLTRYIEPYQSFITTTDADIVVQNFTETCNIIPLGK